MRQLIFRVRADESGSVLVTALAVTIIMLLLGFALLAIVDTQARVSGTERTRDRGFNLAESVLDSEAFVLGRTWPATVPAANPICGDLGAGFSDTLGSAVPASAATERLRKTINPSYTDSAYAGATWQVNLCDDVDSDGAGPIAGSSVWSSSILTTKHTWDENSNGRMWVVAQSAVSGEKRTLAGLVSVRQNSVIPSKYGLVSGGLTDDLGSTVNALTSQALGGVLGDLLGSTPTVAVDPSLTTPPIPASGITGLRCGATDLHLIPTSTCVTGTLGAAGTLPVVNNLLTGGKLAQYPTNTTATAANIEQLRAQAVASGTYTASSLAGANQPCQTAATASSNSVVFIEKVGSGDESCVVDVSAGVKYKALVIGSGRVVLRGDNTATGTPTATTNPQVNTFSGVVYALNRQRLPADQGGQNLGDVDREVIRIEKGAHVKGGVYADGRLAKVGVYPPPLTVNSGQLRDQVCNANIFNATQCFLHGLLGAIGSLVDLVDDLVGINLGSLVDGLADQLDPQRANYGSAIVSDVSAINSVTAYGASGVVPGSFRDLQGR